MSVNKPKEMTRIYSLMTPVVTLIGAAVKEKKKVYRSLVAKNHIALVKSTRTFHISHSNFYK